MKKNYNKDENDRGIKRYIERKIQDDEAEKEIEEYKNTPPEENPDYNDK